LDSAVGRLSTRSSSLLLLLLPTSSSPPITGGCAMRARRAADSPGSLNTGGTSAGRVAELTRSPAPGSESTGGATEGGCTLSTSSPAIGSAGIGGGGSRGAPETSVLTLVLALGSLGSGGLLFVRRDERAAAIAAYPATAPSPGSTAGRAGGALLGFLRFVDTARAKPWLTRLVDGPRDSVVDDSARGSPSELPVLASSAAASRAYLSRSSARSSRCADCICVISHCSRSCAEASVRCGGSRGEPTLMTSSSSLEPSSTTGAVTTTGGAAGRRGDETTNGGIGATAGLATVPD